MKVITVKPVIESQRVSLNEEICKKLDVKKGDFVSFIEDDKGDIVIRKVVV